jgi:hypothetical protein
MKRIIAAVLLSLPLVLLFPQEPSGASGAHDPPVPPELKIDLPLFDLPYQIDAANTAGNFFAAYSTLSMNQSLSLTVDVYSAMHFGMRKLYDNLPLGPVWRNAIFYGGTAAGLLAFAYVLPFGYPWMQQEYTRSVLTRFNINSLNGTYNPFDEIDRVTGVTDDDLARLKEESPHDLVRMQEVTVEGYLLFSDHMLRNRFFYDLHDLSNVTAFLAAYLALFNSTTGIVEEFGGLYGLSSVDDNIEDSYKDDGVQKDRMLYGYSGINWVYDLFRPGEPYAARGLHPSGDGSIARYITISQLSGSEKDYLVKQGWLSYLNFISPMLYGVNTFPFGGTGFEWNVALRHYLTSFGSDTPFQLLVKKAPFNMLFTYHSYANYEHYFPAIEAELLDFPLQIGGLGIYLSPRILVGAQPANQEFMTGDPEFLGLFGLRADFAVSKHFLPYLDLGAKTNGWVAGNESLEAGASIRLGVSMRF